jgi:hypothetical protein
MWVVLMLLVTLTLLQPGPCKLPSRIGQICVLHGLFRYLERSTTLVHGIFRHLTVPERVVRHRLHARRASLKRPAEILVKCTNRSPIIRISRRARTCRCVIGIPVANIVSVHSTPGVQVQYCVSGKEGEHVAESSRDRVR